MRTNTKDEVSLKRILIPIDGSKYSIRAAKYAIEVARLQKAQIFLIQIITRIPYGYGLPGSSINEYFESAKDKAHVWFDNIIYISQKEARKKIVMFLK